MALSLVFPVSSQGKESGSQVCRLQRQAGRQRERWQPGSLRAWGTGGRPCGPRSSSQRTVQEQGGTLVPGLCTCVAMATASLARDSSRTSPRRRPTRPALPTRAPGPTSFHQVPGSVPAPAAQSRGALHLARRLLPLLLHRSRADWPAAPWPPFLRSDWSPVAR